MTLLIIYAADRQEIQMSHLLALDQGTTSSRAIVFDESGQIIALKQQEIGPHPFALRYYRD